MVPPCLDISPCCMHPLSCSILMMDRQMTVKRSNTRLDYNTSNTDFHIHNGVPLRCLPLDVLEDLIHNVYFQTKYPLQHSTCTMLYHLRIGEVIQQHEPPLLDEYHVHELVDLDNTMLYCSTSVFNGIYLKHLPNVVLETLSHDHMPCRRLLMYRKALITTYKPRYTTD